MIKEATSTENKFLSLYLAGHVNSVSNVERPNNVSKMKKITGETTKMRKIHFKINLPSLPSTVLSIASALILTGCYQSFYPSWHQKIPAKERFELVLDDEAVLDRETGLVWEQAPNAANYEQWNIVVDHCYAQTVGERRGWRVPARYEILSLVEASATNTGLPVGHPFVLPGITFWTATEHSYSMAWAFSTNSGDVFLMDKPIKAYLWCVRGGYIGYDVYGNDGP